MTAAQLTLKVLYLELKARSLSRGHIYPQRHAEFGKRGECQAPSRPFLCRLVQNPRGAEIIACQHHNPTENFQLA